MDIAGVVVPVATLIGAVPVTLVTVPCGLDAVVMLVTRPYVSTVTTGINVDDPVVPGVTIPLAKLIVGVVPPLLVMLPAVPDTLVTYVPAGCLLLNVFQSVLVK